MSNDFLYLEKKADEVRDRCGLSKYDSVSFRATLLKLDVIAVFSALGEECFSGMAIKVPNGGDPKRFMLINTSKSQGHQNFTICHELYHLFIQPDFTSQVCKAGRFNKDDYEEFRADIFSSFFLMPESAIVHLTPDNELSKNRITLKTILRIEQTLGCSRTALLHKLKRLNIIDNGYSSQFETNIKRGAFEFGYSNGLYEPTEHKDVIGDYGTLAKELYDKNKISESHYYSLLLDLGINDIDEIEDILRNGE